MPLTKKDVVLIHDDLLATCGSMKAAYNLVKKFNPAHVYINFIIELTGEGLNGREVFDEGIEISTPYVSKNCFFNGDMQRCIVPFPYPIPNTMTTEEKEKARRLFERYRPKPAGQSGMLPIFERRWGNHLCGQSQKPETARLFLFQQRPPKPENSHVGQ